MKKTASFTAFARAPTSWRHLASKGLDEKLMFWEGKGEREPVAVTKFCT